MRRRRRGKNGGQRQEESCTRESRLESSRVHVRVFVARRRVATGKQSDRSSPATLRLRGIVFCEKARLSCVSLVAGFKGEMSPRTGKKTTWTIDGGERRRRAEQKPIFSQSASLCSLTEHTKRAVQRTDHSLGFAQVSQ